MTPVRRRNRGSGYLHERSSFIGTVLLEPMMSNVFVVAIGTRLMGTIRFRKEDFLILKARALYRMVLFSGWGLGAFAWGFGAFAWDFGALSLSLGDSAILYFERQRPKCTLPHAKNPF